MILLKSFVDMGGNYQPHVFEVAMMNHVSTCDAFGWVEHQHQFHQIDKTLTPRFEHTLQSHRTLSFLLDISQSQLYKFSVSQGPIVFLRLP